MNDCYYSIDPPRIKSIVNNLSAICHEENKRWWCDPQTGERIQRNIGELLILVVSELAEAMEGHRKDLMDDKLPRRKMFEVGLADALIRIFDLGGGLGLDLGGALADRSKCEMRVHGDDCHLDPHAPHFHRMIQHLTRNGIPINRRDARLLAKRINQALDAWRDAR